jgi:CBS-domain-containing membrane protein
LRFRRLSENQHFAVADCALILFGSHLTVLEFMQTIADVEAQTGTSPPVTCAKTDSLGKVIETLASKNQYRIYVVDETTRLMGVITLRDIIACFVSEPPGFFDGYFGGAFKEAFVDQSE